MAPGFAAEYKRLRAEAVGQSLARLQRISSAAVSVLGNLLVDPQAPAAVKLGAARTILALAVKAVEIDELAERLSRLEEWSEASQKSQKP
jgi:hypothetical protein